MSSSTPLLEEKREECCCGEGRRWRLAATRLLDTEEAKDQVLFSVPMILTNVSYYCISLISVMFAGHLGELELAGSTLANAWATVTGFALMVWHHHHASPPPPLLPLFKTALLILYGFGLSIQRTPGPPFILKYLCDATHVSSHVSYWPGN